MSFLGEIKRRKVFKVAAVYAVMAWLVIQIIDVINEPLQLPERLDTVVIVLLAVGFPIAMVLAWAFDLSPDGIKAESALQAGDPKSPLPGQSVTLILQALVLIAVGFLVVDHFLADVERFAFAKQSTGASICARLAMEENDQLGRFSSTDFTAGNTSCVSGK